MTRILQPGAGIAVFTDLQALPIPPIENYFAYVAAWNTGGPRSVNAVFEGDLEIWAEGTVSLTGARLQGAVLRDQVLADDDVDTTDFANDELDITSHAYSTSDGPIQLTTSDTLPTGLALLTDYWIIVKTSGTIQLATSLANAAAGTAVAFSDVGVGTHTLVDVATTQRLRWMSYGLLGDNDDGAIDLTYFNGYAKRFLHKPDTVAYTVTATVGSAINISARVQPINRVA